MPPSTTVPRTWREMAPEPLAVTSGMTPRMKANAVIKIGRSRERAASSADSSIPPPAAILARANSTIRMAFFADKPINMTSPICV